MHLKSITLTNFRCFQRLELSLHPRLTVIVADNGGGKTSVLDGIAIGMAPLMRYLSSADQRLSGPGIEDEDFRLVPSSTRGGDERWTSCDFAQVAVATTNGLTWDNWRASSRGKQPESKIGQTDLASYVSTLLDSLKTPAPQLLPVFAYYGDRRGWLAMPERIRETRKNKVNYDFPTSALVGALNSLSDFKEMLRWFDTEEASALRAHHANNGALPEEYQDPPTLAAIRSAILAILGGDYSNPHFEKRKFMVEAKSGPGVLQVSQLSQGYQCMLALAMDFARRLGLANPDLYHRVGDTDFDWSFATDYMMQTHPDGLSDVTVMGPAWAPAVMLIDEVDLHLHPSWQQRVLADLMRAFPCTQFIVTTHSPQIVSTVRRENLRVLEKDEAGEWIARIPDRNPYAHSNALSLEAVMGGNAYPPLEIVAHLREYQRLVGEDKHDSPRARALRTELESEWGKSDPELLRVDVGIRKNETLRKLRRPGA